MSKDELIMVNRIYKLNTEIAELEEKVRRLEHQNRKFKKLANECHA